MDFSARHVRRSAFTLVELMISVALVLILILGVNQVFKYTTQAVGAGEAITAANRDARSLQSTFANDFSGIVGNGSGANDAASLIISSRAFYAFRNPRDQAAEGTVSPSAPGGFPSNNVAFLDLNNDGYFGDPNVFGEVVYPCTYNTRNHRADVLSFFARDVFHRQTGNAGTIVANQASQEAWIWYGHLWLPDNSGAFPLGTGNYPSGYPFNGSVATNPNNYYGSQAVLGRVAMLLSEKPATATAYQAANTIIDINGNKQWFIDRFGGPTVGNLTPLASYSALNTTAGGTTSSDPGSGSTFLYNSRVDLACTSISNFQQKLNNYLTAAPGGYWFQYMLDGSSGGLGGKTTRFQCNPFVTRPMQSVDMAHASPYLLAGCSQFIVEFAGDFLTQDNDPTHVDPTTGAPSFGTAGSNHTRYGDITNNTGDGVLDFTMVNTGTSAAPIWTRQIKWYGMPRSTSGQTTVSYLNGDVVPVRDWLRNAINPSTLSVNSYAPDLFEKIYPSYNTNYYGTSGMTSTEANNGYEVAFGPNDARPKLIRITVTLEDSSGRLPDGKTYQYIFPVP